MNKKIDQKKACLNYIKENLSKVLVKFIYKTKNGSERFATGTIHKNFIKHNFNIDLKGDHKIREGIITYFDTDKKGWRSFREENLKDITHIYNLDPSGKLVFVN